MSYDYNNCEINCFQKGEIIFELRIYLFFFVYLLISRIGDRSHIFSNEVPVKLF